MASFRQTTFDPSVSQQYGGVAPGANAGVSVQQQAINMASMEENLAREMAKMKINDEKRMREVEKICHKSDELKELQDKIKAAYLNKERAAQVSETQFRTQVDIEQDAHVDMIMLRNKELQDQQQRAANAQKHGQLLDNKNRIQGQIQENEKLKQEAFQEYTKEKDQVDAVVQKMIAEDNELARINLQKKDQAQADMILSVNEKRALERRQKEMEEYEDEMVRRYAQQQTQRQGEIQALKDQAELAREEIFLKLKAEEEQRRAEKEFQEHLRNELYMQESEEAALAKERAEAEKRERVKRELQEAKDFQLRLKAERAAEEKRMEDEFKQKLMEKFAEDERLEQMNAQRRRMRELEHKREIERLWQERLAVYKAQREIELQERAAVEAQERAERNIIEQEKQRLLAEHAAILANHHPKANSQYNNFGK